jgi:hypothetical protein
MSGATHPRCPRLFEVEASRDGRLSGVELARFRTHLGACADCAREARELDALSEALREPPGSSTSDELRIRRERTRLLAAFDGTLVPATPPRGAGRLGFVAVAVAALCAIAVVSALIRGKHGAASAVAAAPPSHPDPVTVAADSRARFTRHTEARVEKVTLESGALSIHVARALSPRRLLVVLPDGELEDVGTTFSVSADGGHTTRVTVQEGSIVLRLRGNPTIVLAAGDVWTRPPPPVAPSIPASSAPALPAPHHREEKPVVAAAPSKPTLDSAAGFRAAMTEFNGGHYAEAARLFDAFVTGNPGDSHAEDAAYLRVLALQHVGASGTTRQAARDYLLRYPEGFRRAEVEVLAR